MTTGKRTVRLNDSTVNVLQRRRDIAFDTSFTLGRRVKPKSQPVTTANSQSWALELALQELRDNVLVLKNQEKLSKVPETFEMPHNPSKNVKISIIARTEAKFHFIDSDDDV